MDEIYPEELSLRITQEKMDDAFRARNAVRTIEAGEEKTPTVVSRKAWPAKSEELIRCVNPPFRVVIIPAVFRQDTTRSLSCSALCNTDYTSPLLDRRRGSPPVCKTSPRARLRLVIRDHASIERSALAANHLR